MLASELRAASVIDRLQTGSSNATLEHSQVAALNAALGAALDAALRQLLDAWRAASVTIVGSYLAGKFVICMIASGDPSAGLVYHVCKAWLDQLFPPP